ncbi:putative kinetochore protein NUF2, partial [Grifola frondosa]
LAGEHEWATEGGKSNVELIVEVVDAFSGWGFSVSNEQVARPTAEFVLSIYSACLEQVTGINLDIIQPPVEAALATLDTRLRGKIRQRFANAAKIHDFSAKDLYFPDAERTRAIFSAFINFVKFSEQCESFITRLRDQSTAVIQERREVVREIAELEQKVVDIKAKRAEDEPKCESLRQANTAFMEKVILYKDNHMTLLKDVEELKREKSVFVAKKEKINQETANITESINRTRSRVVQSPERIKRSIVTMGTTAAEEKKIITMNEAKTRDLQAKIQALQNIEKPRCCQDVRLCVEQLLVIQKEMLALDNSQKGLADSKDALDSRKGERTELMMKRERVHKQFSNAQEKSERAQRHAEDKRLASQQTIERLQREYEEMAVERRDNDKQVEELRAEADEIERKMAEHMKRSQAELSELLTEYWKLRHETEVYMEVLANKLGMQVTST